MSKATIYYLEMRQPEALRPRRGPRGWYVEAIEPPDPQLNRRFYVDVGTAWKWTDRLIWSDDDWRRYAHCSDIETCVGRLQGREAGYFELAAAGAGDVQIAYFGLLPQFVGQGLGGALLTAAVERAWSRPATRRVWLHTCTLDHPHALRNYQSRGFRLYKTELV